MKSLKQIKKTGEKEGEKARVDIMSIRHLDLQVNMNSTLNISQQQGERMAAEVAQQKIIDKEAYKDGKIARETVTASHEAEEARINLDDETKEQPANENDGKKNNDNLSDKKKKKATFNIKPNVHNGKINFLA